MCDFNEEFTKAVVSIRQDGYEEGVKAGMDQCFDAAVDIVLSAFTEKATVTKVVYNGDMTIVKFVDGTSSIVRYNPFYGYPYDAEKAIMAAIFKRLFGNSYIKILKEFAKPELYGKAKEYCDGVYKVYSPAPIADVCGETVTPDGAVITNAEEDDYDPAYDTSLWTRLDDDVLGNDLLKASVEDYDDATMPDPFDE